MKDKIIFNFFEDSRTNAVEKLANYFELPLTDVKTELLYGCSVESFIQTFKIDLHAYDSSQVSIVGRHITTSSEDELQSFYKKGLLDLKTALSEDTPLFRLLKEHNVHIDVDGKLFTFNGKSIFIESTKTSEHKCFMGHKHVCGWRYNILEYCQQSYMIWVPLWSFLYLEILITCLIIQP